MSSSSSADSDRRVALAIFLRDMQDRYGTSFYVPPKYILFVPTAYHSMLLDNNEKANTSWRKWRAKQSGSTVPVQARPREMHAGGGAAAAQVRDYTPEAIDAARARARCCPEAIELLTAENETLRAQLATAEAAMAMLRARQQKAAVDQQTAADYIAELEFHHKFQLQQRNVLISQLRDALTAEREDGTAASQDDATKCDQEATDRAIAEALGGRE